MSGASTQTLEKQLCAPSLSRDSGRDHAKNPGSSFCIDWTSNVMSDQTNVGRTDLTDFEWTNVFFQTCERTGVRLFCFEQ